MKEIRPEPPNRTLKTKDMDFFLMKTVNWRAMAAHSHFHDAIEVIYMNRGSVSVSVNGAKTSIYPGDLALFHSRAIHTIWTEDEVDNNYYVLKILPDVLFRLCSEGRNDAFALRFLISNPSLKTVWRGDELKGTDVELGMKRLIESLDVKRRVDGISRTVSALMVLNGLYQSDKEAMKGLTVTAEALYSALFYINGHFTEPITEEQAAEKANMSISSFSRVFKREMGQGFKDYLNGVRTSKARTMLLGTRLSVREIAVACGYNNVSHFISVYKRYKGKTPLEERKSAAAIVPEQPMDEA